MSVNTENTLKQATATQIQVAHTAVQTSPGQKKTETVANKTPLVDTGVTAKAIEVSTVTALKADEPTTKDEAPKSASIGIQTDAIEEEAPAPTAPAPEASSAEEAAPAANQDEVNFDEAYERAGRVQRSLSRGLRRMGPIQLIVLVAARSLLEIINSAQTKGFLFKALSRKGI